MILDDAEVAKLTGCRKGTQRASTLRRWLLEHGYVEDVTFFKRVDGWYSVMAPQARTVVLDRPRLKSA